VIVRRAQYRAELWVSVLPTPGKALSHQLRKHVSDVHQRIWSIGHPRRHATECAERSNGIVRPHLLTHQFENLSVKTLYSLHRKLPVPTKLGFFSKLSRLSFAEAGARRFEWRGQCRCFVG